MSLSDRVGNDDRFGGPPEKRQGPCVLGEVTASGHLHRATYDAISLATTLAADPSLKLGGITLMVLGDQLSICRQTLAELPVDRVLAVEDPSFASFCPVKWVSAITRALGEESPAVFVAGHTYRAIDFLPRLAMHENAIFLPEILEVDPVPGDGRWPSFVRPVMQGKLWSRSRPARARRLVLTVREAAFAQAGDASLETKQVQRHPHPPVYLPVPLDGTLDRTVARGRRIVETIEPSAGGVDLSNADRIVSIGRGLGDPEGLSQIRALADAMDASLAASRPVVDNGWLPRAHQVGSSGQTVAPRLYLALGISGSIQHMQGMQRSECVVAVNLDPEAPIFGVSNFGIVGDLNTIVPALIRCFESASTP